MRINSHIPSMKILLKWGYTVNNLIGRIPCDLNLKNQKIITHETPMIVHKHKHG